MELEQIYYVGELIGVVVVAASLLFVGVQMRQNTTALRAQSHHAFTQAINQPNLAIAQSRDLAELFGNGLMDRGSLDDVQRGRLDNLLLAYLHALDTLHYQTRIGASDPELLEARVPNLILQPLVENAIKHGIAPRAEGGKISISASQNQNMLRLAVKDNGPGSSAEGIFQASEGLGLVNTKKRLQQLYKTNYQFEVKTEINQGFTVTLTFPLKYEIRRPQANVTD